MLAVEIVDGEPPDEEEDVDAPAEDFAAPGVLLVFVLLEPHPAAISATTGKARKNGFRIR
jgi:hypothetical protein